VATGTPRPQRPASPLRYRRSARRLTAGQRKILRDAFRASIGVGDDRGYAYWAGIHGLPRPIGCDNAHGSPYFLPWHRAYLYFFERSLRDRVRDTSLVWWDWRRHDIPPLFDDATDAEGNPNQLASAPVDPIALQQGANSHPPMVVPPDTERFPGAPPQLPSAQEVRDVLGRGEFLDFSGALEQLHNRVHGWVNGHMGTIEFAAFDPIFWAHHTMVDRIWRVWQLRYPGARPPSSILDQALPPFRMTVRQTLDVTALGYDYAASTASVSAVGGT
jgi:tyrosinase